MFSLKEFLAQITKWGSVVKLIVHTGKHGVSGRSVAQPVVEEQEVDQDHVITLSQIFHAKEALSSQLVAVEIAAVRINDFLLNFQDKS